MFGNWVNFYVLEDLAGVKSVLNQNYEPGDGEYIVCLTELLFDPDDLGHSCYMLLDLDTSEDEGEKQWYIDHNEYEIGTPYWYHYNRIRTLKYLEANIPGHPRYILVRISF